MPYVRKRGNQIAIVHGQRDGEGKVQQLTLFTLYSKEEAREAIGKGDEDGDAHFRSLLQYRYPMISFNWKRIAKEIEANLDALPETYPYREKRLGTGFHEDLCAFSRQIMLADPQILYSSAEVIRSHRYELEFLCELIGWRLRLCERKEGKWNRDNRFFWRYEMQRMEVPADLQEFVEALEDRGDDERLEAAVRLLIDCFPNHADGHNDLGWIADDRGNMDEAIRHFTRAAEVGRRLFPKRMAKRMYWNQLSTRPYVRALRNLSLVLNYAGRYEEAIEVCDRLEDECGDDVTAASQRGRAFLNMGKWREAAQAARHVHQLHQAESFVAAFALFEMGDDLQALSDFLYGAIHYPRSARMLTGKASGKVESSDEARDHNAGVDLTRGIEGYLKGPRNSLRFFRQVMRAAPVVALLDEAVDVAKKWKQQRRAGERGAFDRLREMEKLTFAWERAKEILAFLRGGRAAPCRRKQEGAPSGSDAPG